MAVSSYDGPTRAEILHQILNYNETHHIMRSIELSSVGSESDLLDLKQVDQNEKHASESARQIQKFIKELWTLRRGQVSEGKDSSLDDWTQLLAAGKRIVASAERGMATFDGKAHARDKQKRVVFKEDLSRRVMKPSESITRVEKSTKRAETPMSSNRLPQIFPPLSSPESLNKPGRGQSAQYGHSYTVIMPIQNTAKPPELRYHDGRSIVNTQNPQTKGLHVVESKSGNRYLQDTNPRPEGAMGPNMNRAKKPAHNDAQRRTSIEQKEMMAHLKAKQLQSEVRKLSFD